jgi:ABC-type branched-subunit amino acid transport system substrate-binding protein
VARALRDAGWEGVFLGGPELAATDFAAVAGEAAKGARFVTPWPFPADTPGSADFVAAYRGMGPHVEPPGPLALPAYDATRQVLEALESDIAAHGTPTREGMAAALADVELGDVTLYWYRIGADGVPGYTP